MKPLVLSSEEIEVLLDRKGLMKAMVEGLMQFSSGEALNFARHAIATSEDGVLGFMPALARAKGLLGYKVVSVLPKNTNANLNPHQGIVILLNSNTGVVQAILDGEAITAYRTAAVSAAATQSLSYADAESLALIGAGRQALEHALALKEIRNIKNIAIWSPRQESAKKLTDVLQQKLDCHFYTVETPQQAVENAEIVVTCTNSRHPLFNIHDVKPGAHINAIGACRPGFLEVALVDRQGLKIFVDSKAACAAEADELKLALESGSLSFDAIQGEIGNVFSGNVVGREHASEITFFKSVGLGIEDLFAADFFDRRSKDNRYA